MRIPVGSRTLTRDDVVAVARHGAEVVIDADALDAMTATRALIAGLAHDTVPHYGVSTGFGALATTHIPLAKRAELQRSLVRSHAASSGPEVEREVVRGTMLLRLQTLTTARTGARPVVAETYDGWLNDAESFPGTREHAFAALDAATGGKVDRGWGTQIRSYLLYDNRVKDHRTGHEAGNPQTVLDGALQPFIDAELLRRRATRENTEA